MAPNNFPQVAFFPCSQYTYWYQHCAITYLALSSSASFPESFPCYRTFHYGRFSAKTPCLWKVNAFRYYGLSISRLSLVRGKGCWCASTESSCWEWGFTTYSVVYVLLLTVKRMEVLRDYLDFSKKELTLKFTSLFLGTYPPHHMPYS